MHLSRHPTAITLLALLWCAGCDTRGTSPEDVEGSLDTSDVGQLDVSDTPQGLDTVDVEQPHCDAYAAMTVDMPADPRRIAFAPNGDAYLTFYVETDTNWPGTGIVPGWILTRLPPSGLPQWTVAYGRREPLALDATLDGEVVVLGLYDDVPYLERYDDDGEETWTAIDRWEGTQTMAHASEIAVVDADAAIYAAGIQFDHPAGSCNGACPAWLARLGPTGVLEWEIEIPSPDSGHGYVDVELVAGESGAALVLRWLVGTLPHATVVQVDPTGQVQGTAEFRDAMGEPARLETGAALVPEHIMSISTLWRVPSSGERDAVLSVGQPTSIQTVTRIEAVAVRNDGTIMFGGGVKGGQAFATRGDGAAGIEGGVPLPPPPADAVAPWAAALMPTGELLVADLVRPDVPLRTVVELSPVGSDRVVVAHGADGQVRLVWTCWVPWGRL